MGFLFWCFFFGTFNVILLFLFRYLVCIVITIFQRDFKRMIAYFSVFHITSVFYSFYLQFCSRIFIRVLIIFLHSLTSALFFLFSSEVFYRLKTRNLNLSLGVGFYGGDIAMVFLFLLLFYNLGGPPFMGFFFEVGVFYLFLVYLKQSWRILFISFLFNLVLMLKLVSRFWFGKCDEGLRFLKGGVLFWCFIVGIRWRVLFL